MYHDVCNLLSKVQPKTPSVCVCMSKCVRRKRESNHFATDKGKLLTVGGPRSAVLRGSDFAYQGTFGDIWRHFTCHNRYMCGVLMASNR